LVCLAGCVSTQSRSADARFDRAWRADSRNQEAQPLAEYLKWVDSFYDGSPFVPGWTRRQAELCSTAGPEAEARVERLGQILAAEWAKSNALRRVDSGLLARIAGILADARDRDDLIRVTDELIDDVRAVLAGDRVPEAMTRERYSVQPVSREKP
jgi:hypothetical protein